MQKALITGGAGFIGSNLAARLVADGVETVIYDSLHTGHERFIADLIEGPNASFLEADVLDKSALIEAMSGCDVIFHLQANADVRHGLEDPTRDLEQNTIATSNVLEAMRHTGTERIVFSSTGSIYGEPEIFPTPEDAPFPTQTSLYGASKLACEGLIQAYCNGYGIVGTIFRFVSILGPHYTHGHVFDFYGSLRRDPQKLTVLGDGKQEKSYLHVSDCIEGLLTGLAATAKGEAAVFNLGTDETVVVDRSVEIITTAMGVTPEIEHTGGTRGWVGDSPLILLDCSKLRALGWQPHYTIESAIRETTAWFDSNPWVFETVHSGVADS